MIKKCSVWLGLIVGIMFWAGCAEKTTRLDMDFGTSHKLSKFNQILDPEAEKNLEPVYGQDGQAAQSTMDRYRKGFEKPAAPPPVTISIGGMGK